MIGGSPLVTHRRKESEKHAARALIVAGGLAVMLVGSAMLLKQPTPQATDNCLPSSDSKAGNTVMLIDVTDAPTGLFRDELRDFVTQSAKRMQEFRKLKIYGLEDADPVLLFEMCAPGNPTPRDHIGKSRESIRQQQEKHKKFADAAGERVMRFVSANEKRPHAISKSRIIRALHDILSTSIIDGARHQHLIVYSDLFENSEVTSFYDGVDRDRVAEVFSGPFKDLMTSLGSKASGVSFSVCQVLPSAGSDSEKMAGAAARFWFEILDADRGRSQCLEGLSRIPGASSGCKPDGWKCGEY